MIKMIAKILGFTSIQVLTASMLATSLHSSDDGCAHWTSIFFSYTYQDRIKWSNPLAIQLKEKNEKGKKSKDNEKDNEKVKKKEYRCKGGYFERLIHK